MAKISDSNQAHASIFYEDLPAADRERVTRKTNFGLLSYFPSIFQSWKRERDKSTMGDDHEGNICTYTKPLDRPKVIRILRY